ncbi:hypothetical protein [Streptomyces longwoodensis]|uniref:hypothetical protein n=1 Tax=Streptomyces longwoodensis TaxID=68231 RepID=UPI00225AF23E|nr:hypothetical protein [Streptomyces longwoodensis]MCX4993871.1 hypothetical protein [Streptomyces longwoodensis]
MADPRTYFAAVYEAGDAWLADCSAQPDLVREAWRLGALAPIPSGTAWLAAETRLVAGVQAHARIRSGRCGPVLADPAADRTWWLIPPGAAEDLADVRTVHVHPHDWLLHCPPTGRQLCGRLWLSPPDGSGRLTHPLTLAAALGPGALPAEAAS